MDGRMNSLDEIRDLAPEAVRQMGEMLGMVSKILRSGIMNDIVSALYGQDLQITTESMTHLSTNLWTSPMGAPQLLGLGIKSSITGKHAWYTDARRLAAVDDSAAAVSQLTAWRFTSATEAYKAAVKYFV